MAPLKNALLVTLKTKCLPMWGQIFCFCRSKYFASMDANFLPLPAHTNFWPMWAQSFCLHGCKFFSSGHRQNVFLCGCQMFASMGAKFLPPWAQIFFASVGANILPLWAHTKCLPMWAQIFGICGCTQNDFLCGHKTFTSMDAVFFCFCRCKYFAFVGAIFLPLWAHTKCWHMWAQNYCLCGCTHNVCLCGHKDFASMGVNFFCFCRCKYFASVGTNFLSLWEHKKCLPLWGAKLLPPWDHGCKLLASVGAHKMLAYVGTKLLPPWVQNYCLCGCRQSICLCGCTQNVCPCGHKYFASMGANCSCFCRYKYFALVGTNLLHLWAHTKCSPMWVQNISLQGCKIIASWVYTK
jgi:hypothetical protein